MIKDVLIGDQPALRKKAAPVDVQEISDPNFQQAIDELIETMEVKDGLGLAAPQIGISKQIVIVSLQNKARCLINPKITVKSKEVTTGEEGCLSFPGLFGDVTRHESVEVKALDRDGKEQTISAQDLGARTIQHELDHLAGILLPDRLKEQPSPRAKKKLAVAGKSL